MMKKLLLYILFQWGALFLLAQGSALLFVHAPVLAPEDTLVLYLQKERITEFERNPYESVVASNKNGMYSFKVDLDTDWTWVGMNLSYQKVGATNVHTVLQEMLLEIGDSVHMYLKPKEGVFLAFGDGYNGVIPRHEENWNASFSGRGAEKYEALWEIKHLNEQKRRGQLLDDMDGDFALNILKVRTQVKEESMALLEKYKPILKPKTYRLLEGQVLGQLGYEFGRLLGSLNRNPKNKENVEMRKYRDAYLDEARDLIKNMDENYIHAPMYIDYLTEYSWLVFLDDYKKEESSTVKQWYSITKDLFPLSPIRDRVLAYALLKRFPDSPNKDLLEDAFLVIKDEFSLDKISPLRNLLQGTKAYSFSLPDANGDYHSLVDYKGKVVFMDFWFAACGPCQAYMMNVVGPVKELYKDNPNVVFVTVSIDDLKTFKAMLAKDNFLPKGGAHLYTDGQGGKHPIIQHYQIRGYPFPILIAKDGSLLSEMFGLNTISGIEEGIEYALSK